MSAADRKVLLILAALWGGSFVLIRIASPVFGPVLMVEARVLIAGITLFGYSRVCKVPLGFRRWWRQYLILGAINSAIPFLLVSAAEVRLSASLAVLLNATSPLFGALVSAAFLNDRLTLRKLAGISIAFAGVGGLVGWSHLKMDRATVLSISACLTAAATYGFAGLYIKTTMAKAPAVGMAAGSMIGAALLIAPLAACNRFVSTPTPAAIVSVLTLALVSTTIAYILYFKLVMTAGPARALSVTFLTPVFGLMWGAVVLGESVTIVKIAACATILAGTGLMLGVGRRHTSST